MVAIANQRDIVFRVEKRLPYDLIRSPQNPVYNVDDYTKSQLYVFSNIHKNVKSRLLDSKDAMCAQQNFRFTPVTLKVGDSVMIRVPERNSKLSSELMGPRIIVQQLKGNMVELLDPCFNTLNVVHNDRLKRTSAKPDLTLVDTARKSTVIRLDNTRLPTNPYHHRFL